MVMCMWSDCYAPNFPGAKFCSKCGRALPETEDSPLQNAAEEFRKYAEIVEKIRKSFGQSKPGTIDISPEQTETILKDMEEFEEYWKFRKQGGEDYI